MNATKHKTQIVSSLFPLLAGVLLTVFSGCSGGASEEKKEEVKQEGDKIILTAEQVKAVNIEIGQIEMRNLRSVVRAAGQLDVPPQNKADITVLTGGTVKQILVLEGNHVSKGQTLLMIENPEFIKMQQDYLTTKNRLTFLETEYKRQKDLNDQNAGTLKTFQQTESDYNTAKVSVAALEKQLQQINVNVKSLESGTIASQVAVVAPINGTVAHISVNLGSYAEPTKTLMDIVDNSQIHCDLMVYEKDLSKVKTGQKVSFTLTNQNNKQIDGEIYGVNQSFEGESKAVIAHAIIKNTTSDNLFPGMYVSALIEVGDQKNMSVPVDAVVRSEGKQFIFVQDEQHATAGEYAFKKVEVTTGVSDLGYIEITPVETLSPQSKIVTKNAFFILSKTQASGEEE